ncbi:unnamed protein product [Mycena citricolor]|uniref:Uncharacterized protein n=1 Tax=Mycena citricolor TaxID=2018698 RepID=A0AAD2JUQ4_9AGAR|nr:unnamed protein product [Mycena citricolor]
MSVIDEDIDNETLQAQIDLSMSFTDNLVASWIKPSAKHGKSSSSTLESELKEYMRRPPRLGVGAPLPELANSSRTADRLKSRLTDKGKKRAREEEEAEALKEDLEDVRGSSGVKKARIDPFAGNGKKKKKITAVPQKDETKSAMVLEEKPSVEERREEISERAETIMTAKKKKKRKKEEKSNTEENIALAGVPVSKLVVPLPIPSTTVAPNRSPAGTDHKTKGPSSSPTIERPSLTAATAPGHPSISITGPILNLNGPPPQSDESDVDNRDPAASKKKRRKRNKKKKKSLLAVPQDDGPTS